MESNTDTITAAEEGNRRALAHATVAHLRSRTDDAITAALLDDLDADGWAIIQNDMGRTRPFSPATQRLVVSLRAAEEAAAAEVVDDPFAGIV